MTDIKVFKLISGEEIIGKVAEAGYGYELENPATIMMQQTEKGIGMALMAYMPYADGTIKLYQVCIASEGEPSLKMVNEYNRLFGSGIEIVSAGAIQTA
jgi:hypothetical protein